MHALDLKSVFQIMLQNIDTIVLCKLWGGVALSAFYFVVQYTREAAKISGLHHMSLYKQTSHLEQKYSSQPRYSGIAIFLILMTEQRKICSHLLCYFCISCTGIIIN